MKTILCLLALALSPTLALHAADAPTREALLKDTAGFLVKADKSAASDTALKTKKYTFIYFSAHWCPPCKIFTPELVNFYNDNAKNNDFELLFVSSDRNQEAMFSYMTETKMPWIGLKLDSPAKKHLSSTFKIAGIPALVLIDQDGKVLASSFDDQGEYQGADVALKKYLALHEK